MADYGIDLIKELFSDEEVGLRKVFELTNESGDWQYALKFDKKDNMLIVVTEVPAEKVEIFRIDITRLV